MNITVVIPTYNEAANVGRMIDALQTEFSHSPQHAWSILVVEGNSPDGTADVVKAKAKDFPNVHLLMEEKKSGLGAAYLCGFKYAILNLAPDVLVEMDADFQHDPKDIVRLVAPIDKGYDYVIGSRFTKGGGIPRDWELYRKFLSVGGNLFTKIVLGIYNISDFTSGFKASRVAGFVDKMNLSEILSGGFAYKIDLLYRMHQLGAKMFEIPIIFGLRDRGDSKMEKNNFSDSLRVVLTLRLGKYLSFFKFILVGFTGLFVDVGLFNLSRLVIPSVYAAIFSGGLAMMTTYILNNAWSFSDRKILSLNEKLKTFAIYVLSSSIPVIFRSQLVRMVINSLGDNLVYVNIAFFAGIILGLVWNYTIYSRIIWRKIV